MNVMTSKDSVALANSSRPLGENVLSVPRAHDLSDSRLRIPPSLCATGHLQNSHDVHQCDAQLPEVAPSPVVEQVFQVFRRKPIV